MKIVFAVIEGFDNSRVPDAWRAYRAERIPQLVERYREYDVKADPVPVKPHENACCDDSNEVLCRLEVRQVNETAVNEATTRAAFLVQGNEATSDAYVRETAERLVTSITRYCGGAGRVVVPQVVA